jgi:hypothetical protein
LKASLETQGMSHILDLYLWTKFAVLAGAEGVGTHSERRNPSNTRELRL